MHYRPLQPQPLIQRVPIVRKGPTNRADHSSPVHFTHYPPTNHHNQSPSIVSRPASQYMLHLIPKVSPPPLQPHPSAIRLDIHDNHSNQSNSILKPPQTHNLASTRTRQLSQYSNKKSQIHQEYFTPPSPSNIRQLQPIRRISQHHSRITDNYSIKSTQNNQDINIVVETKKESFEQSPPKIILTHIQNNGDNTKQESRIVLNDHPHSFIAGGTPLKIVEQSAIGQLSSEQRYENYSTNQHQLQVVNHHHHQAHFPTHIPATQQLKTQENFRQHSLSVDSKSLFKQHPPRPKEFNQFEAQASAQINTENNNEFDHIKTSELSINTSKIPSKIKMMNKRQTDRTSNEVNNIRNEYYMRKQQNLHSELSGEPSHKLSAYLYEHKLSIYSRKYIDEVFQNETHKALLRMQQVRSLSHSRHRSLKRHFF